MFYRIVNRIARLLLEIIAECTIRLNRKTDAELVVSFCDWLMDKGYLKTESEEEAAASMGVTPQQLSTFCRTRLGKTFRQIRKEYRIREVQYLLKDNPDLPLDILGECVGISDKSNLRKQFIEIVGCSPREWVSRNSHS